MNQRILLILNTASLIFTLVINSLSNTGVFNGKTVGEVSDDFESMFAPAGYAFTIWGVIYILLIMFVGYQWFAWLKYKDDYVLKQTGFWFALSNIANIAWIVAWLYTYIGLSVFLMLVLMFSLICLVVKHQLGIRNVSKQIVVFVWWPIGIYLGWIIVATVANVAAFLVSINWQESFMNEQTWTIVMIIAAVVIYVLLISLRNMRGAGMVGLWALIAIAVKQWEIQPAIVTTAIISSVVLIIAIILNFITKLNILRKLK